MIHRIFLLVSFLIISIGNGWSSESTSEGTSEGKVPLRRTPGGIQGPPQKGPPQYAPPSIPNLPPQYAPPSIPNLPPQYAPPSIPNLPPQYAPPLIPSQEALRDDPTDYGKLPGVPADLAHCTDAFKASCTPENCGMYINKFYQCRKCEMPNDQLEACIKASQKFIKQSGAAVAAVSGAEAKASALEIYEKLAALKSVIDKQKYLRDLLSNPISEFGHRTIQPPEDLKKMSQGFEALEGLLSDIEKKYPSLKTKPSGPDTLLDNWDNALLAQANSVVGTTIGTLSILVAKQIEAMQEKKRTTELKDKLATILQKVQQSDSTLKGAISQNIKAGTVYEFQAKFLDDLRERFQDALATYKS